MVGHFLWIDIDFIMIHYHGHVFNFCFSDNIHIQYMMQLGATQKNFIEKHYVTGMGNYVTKPDTHKLHKKICYYLQLEGSH